jgi:hypothetical protein
MIAQDEARHMQLGRHYFEWLGDRLSDPERKRLAAVAVRTLRLLAAAWQSEETRPPNDRDRELGIVDRRTIRTVVLRAVREDVIAPLARLGIEIAPGSLTKLGINV